MQTFEPSVCVCDSSAEEFCRAAEAPRGQNELHRDPPVLAGAPQGEKPAA